MSKAGTYRYQLDESSRKFRCPGCQKKRFVRFKDQATGKYVPEQYGRCDREVNCGYFTNPYQDGFSAKGSANWREIRRDTSKKPPPDYISQEIFAASLQSYSNNIFVKYLNDLFDPGITESLIKNYRIGSSKHWEGATVFWQIDSQEKVRSGKVMLYDDAGHRVKKPYSFITWAHSLLYDDYNLEQCLFGEHLLTADKTVPIAIVESEKTAVICSALFPEFIWLAAGAKSNLKPDRRTCLMERQVALFPDLGAYEDWQEKADDLSYFCDIEVSSLLEERANKAACKEGYDLADYLVKCDLSDFKNKHKAPKTSL